MTVNHGGVATERSEEVLRSIQAQHGEPRKVRFFCSELTMQGNVFWGDFPFTDKRNTTTTSSLHPATE